MNTYSNIFRNSTMMLFLLAFTMPTTCTAFVGDGRGSMVLTKIHNIEIKKSQYYNPGNMEKTRDMRNNVFQMQIQQQRQQRLFMSKEGRDNKDELDNDITAGTGSTNNGDNNKSGNWIENLFTIEETRILAGDAVSCLLVCQLLALTDVLSDPSFWADGGFAQPLSIPPTLPTLVSRDCEITIAWVIASLKNRGYTYAAIGSDESALKCAFWIWLDHCSLRILFALVVSVVVTKMPVDGWELVRQLWVTLLMLPTFRLIFGQNNR